MQGIEPFTKEFKEKIENCHGLHFMCKKCNYEISYFHEINSFKEVLKTVKLHLKNSHGVIIK